MNPSSYVRYRKKQSRIQRMLQQIVRELRNRMLQRRERLQSLMWSLSVHGALLSLLALMSLPMQRMQRNELVMIEAMDTGDDLGELDISTIDFSSLDIMEAPEPLLNQESPSERLDELLITPDVESSVNAELSDNQEEDQAATVPTALASLGNDELRIAEADRRVGAAGGNTQAPIRVSLLFDGDDDLDLDLQYRILKTTRDRVEIDRLFEPRINFLLRTNPHGALDVDANALRVVPEPCENIIITDPPLLAEYTVRVSVFRYRGDRTATPMVVMIRYGDKTKVFKEQLTPGQRSKTIHTFRFASK